MDLSKLSTEDLMALKGGDLSKVSTAGLMALKNQQGPVSSTPAPVLDTGLRAMTGSLNPNPPTLVPKEGQVPMTTGEQAGQMVADKMAEAGHPIAAGIMLNTPAAYNAAQALTATPELAQAISQIPGALKQGVKAIGKRILQGPATEQAIGMRNEIASLGTQQTAKEATLEQLRKQAGSSIESLRGQYNVPQQLSATEVPKDLNEFADTMKSLQSRRPEDLAKTMGLDGLMKLRDTAKATLESGVSKTQAAFINRGISQIDSAVEVIHTEVSNAFKQYETVQQAAEALPNDVDAKKQALLKALRINQPEVSSEKALRRGVGIGTGAIGIGSAGLAALKRLGFVGH